MKHVKYANALHVVIIGKKLIHNKVTYPNIPEHRNPSHILPSPNVNVNINIPPNDIKYIPTVVDLKTNK